MAQMLLDALLWGSLVVSLVGGVVALVKGFL